MIVFTEKTPEGFHLLILKVDETGHLCGYIGLPCEHPLYQMDYTQCLLGCQPEMMTWGKLYQDLVEIGAPPLPEMPEGVAAHTWPNWPCVYDQDHPSAERLLECHGGVTYAGDACPGMEEHLWYFGFDCAHAWDLVPGREAPFPAAAYRDEEYVKAQVDSLLHQVRAYVLVKDIPNDVRR